MCLVDFILILSIKKAQSNKQGTQRNNFLCTNNLDYMYDVRIQREHHKLHLKQSRQSKEYMYDNCYYIQRKNGHAYHQYHQAKSMIAFL